MHLQAKRWIRQPWPTGLAPFLLALLVTVALPASGRADEQRPAELAIEGPVQVDANPDLKRLPGGPLARARGPQLPPEPPEPLARPLPHGTPERGTSAEDQAADPDAWALPELIDLALANNPVLARASARIAALRGTWVQVGLPPNPTAGYMAEEIGDAGTAGKQGAFVGQQFITADKLPLNRAVVNSQILQAQQQWAAVRQRIVTDVQLAFGEVLVAQRRLELAAELADVSDRAVQASRELLQAQEISQIAVLQTEIVAQDTQIVRRRAANELTAAWQQLTSVIGVPQLERQTLSGDLEQIIPPLDWEATLARLLRESPEVASAAAEIQRARRALARARVERYPDLNLQVAVLHDDISEDTLTNIQLGMPIPIFDRNQGGIQRARAEVAQARRDLERVELALRQRLALAFQQYADARVQVDLYADQILPKARRTLELVSDGYRAGEVGYLEMLTAQRTYFQTTLSYLDALRQLWRASVQIDGLLLDSSLQSGQNAGT